MPKGPRGELSPADVVSCAVTVAKIATGEILEQAKPTAPPTSECQAAVGHSSDGC